MKQCLDDYLQRLARQIHEDALGDFAGLLKPVYHRLIALVTMVAKALQRLGATGAQCVKDIVYKDVSVLPWYFADSIVQHRFDKITGRIGL